LLLHFSVLLTNYACRRFLKAISDEGAIPSISTMPASLNSLQDIKDSFWDYVFPPVCLSCGEIGNFFCNKCQQKSKLLGQFLCPSCLKTSPTPKKHPECKGIIDGLISCWDYEGVVQKIIKEIKYRQYYAGIKNLTTSFLYYLNKKHHTEFLDFLETKPIVIPVPLHKKRLRQRGFNQAFLIAQIIAQHFHLPISEKLLERVKATKPQAEMTKNQRLENVKNAFKPTKQLLLLGNNSLQNKNFLVIDDVWTTGATIKTCAKALKSLGANKIWALTLAR
jgi:competence protein ComFC